MQRWAILFGLPLLLLTLCLWWQPFPYTTNSQTLSTRNLSSAQFINLKRAAQPLDGLVLAPGEIFSFNKTLGPRTTQRGYLPAPSYLGGESPSTVGGGICLLSSALYQLALKTGLDINARTPHLRTIHSVPPGLDATVWYGREDLRFTNTLGHPLRLSARLDRDTLRLALWSTKPVQPQTVKRILLRRNAKEIQVQVLRNQHLISSDLYRLSP
jgi:vancomycin resistance protein YoaR